MYRLITVVFLLVSCNLLSGCFLFGGDDDQPRPIPPIEQLPPITSEGKGTFGCLVNGEPFVDNYPDVLVDYSPDNTLYLRADISDPESSLGISIRNYNREEYKINLSDSSVQFSIWDSDYQNCNYIVGSLVSGWVDIIEYNSFEDYVSGTFEFTSYNNDCDTLRVTDGRFDLRVRR